MNMKTAKLFADAIDSYSRLAMNKEKVLDRKTSKLGRIERSGPFY